VLFGNPLGFRRAPPFPSRLELGEEERGKRGTNSGPRELFRAGPNRMRGSWKVIPSNGGKKKRKKKEGRGLGARTLNKDCLRGFCSGRRHLQETRQGKEKRKKRKRLSPTFSVSAEKRAQEASDLKTPCIDKRGKKEKRGKSGGELAGKPTDVFCCLGPAPTVRGKRGGGKKKRNRK